MLLVIQMPFAPLFPTLSTLSQRDGKYEESNFMVCKKRGIATC